MMNLRKMSKTKERGPGAKAGSRFLPIGLIAGPAGGIVTTLLKNWKIAIFGLLVAIIAYQNTVSFEFLSPFGVRTIPGLQQDIVKAEERVRTAQEQVIECDLSRERLKAAIETTNAQIERWAALSSQLQNSNNQLSGRLAELAETSEQQIEVILQGPVPQTCEGAIKLLRDAVVDGELKW